MIKSFKHQWVKTGFQSWTCSKCGCIRKRFGDKPVYYYIESNGVGCINFRPPCKLNTEK